MEFYSITLSLCSWCVLWMLWMSCTDWWNVLSHVGGRLRASSQPVERLESGCSPWPRSCAAAWELVTSSCVTAEYTGQPGLHTHTLTLLLSFLSDRHQAFARDSKWNASVFSSPVFFPFLSVARSNLLPVTYVFYPVFFSAASIFLQFWQGFLGLSRWFYCCLPLFSLSSSYHLIFNFLFCMNM